MLYNEINTIAMTRKSRNQGGAKVSHLHDLQQLIVQCLKQDLKNGLEQGEVNQAAIRNALQLLRDNDIVATPDAENELMTIANLLPENLIPVSTFSRYE